MDAPAAGPVRPDELPALFGSLTGAARIGVAVSGGPDSTALLILLDRWARARADGPALHILTVNHGLRSAASAETAAVVALADRLGWPARTLVWEHGGTKPEGDLQAAAREARYRLLATAAVDAGLHAVTLGHTRDDVAETLLIRLGRGSGLRGLAGMAPERVVHGIRFVRPLLGVPKARLIATAEEAGVPYVEDPSNGDGERFLRARVRALLPLLVEIGIDPERLAGTAERLRRASTAVDHHVDGLRRAAATDHGGVFAVDRRALVDAPDEIALRLLSDLTRQVRPGPHPPQSGPLERLLAALRSAAARRTVCAGVALDPRRDTIWLYAEAGRAGFPTLAVGPGRHVWDGRFQVTVTGDAPDGLAVGPARGAARRADLPSAAAESLPAIYVSGELSPHGHGWVGTSAWSAAIEPLVAGVSSTKS